MYNGKMTGGSINAILSYVKYIGEGTMSSTMPSYKHYTLGSM